MAGLMESTATVTGGQDEAATEIKSSSSSLEGSTDCSAKMEAPKMLAGGAKEAVEAATGPAEADEEQEEALQDRYQEKEDSRDDHGPEAQEAPEEAPAGSSEVKMSKGKVALIMLALCTIVTTALPTIAREFNTSQADYAWVGSAYLLGAASSTPSWGKVSDIFGRKPVLLAANVVFLIGSLLCGVSINIKMLVASRVVQGIGSGGLLTLVNICVSDLFSMRTRSMYFGIIGMVWAISGIIGPVIGGLMTQYTTWRWCFYINLPIDGVAFLIIFFFLELHTPTTPLLAGLRAIDWLGSLAVVGGTVMFLIGLEYGGESYPWSSPTVICLIVFGIVTWGIFILIQWKVSRYPVMPLWLFTQRSTLAAYGTVLIHGAIYTSGSFFLPLYFQAVLGETPLKSGILLFPNVIAVSIVSAVTGIFIRKTGLCLPPIWFGTTVLVLGTGLYINLPSHRSLVKVILYQLVAGMGIGPNFQAPIIALQSHIRPSDIATATASIAFCRNLASSISVVIGGVIIQNRLQSNILEIQHLLSPKTLNALQGVSAGASVHIIQALPPNEKQPVLDAYTKSLSTMWIFYTALAAIGFIVSLLLQKKKLNKEHEVTKTGLDAQERARKERLQMEKEAKSSRNKAV
ncbi:multidrug resistance protein [Trichophyton tonsurans CBS 112818]|uniref:Efflux pump dotC n=1 Tax=Trichophyton tonsurans (strain CBS 112818) TaxID=647933 RepID=F2S9P9_TRIT1|nr:multidrug resistance protein [Trichophyton tonsurans CBS 112818]